MNLVDQNRLLHENRQLLRDKDDLQNMNKQMEQALDENQSLRDQIDEMKTNQAMVIGFAEGSAMTSTINNLKSELASALQRVKELEYGGGSVKSEKIEFKLKTDT
jgi:predicted RNase H-like nuclease (RuvC/YqgF family)